MRLSCLGDKATFAVIVINLLAILGIIASSNLPSTLQVNHENMISSIKFAGRKLVAKFKPNDQDDIAFFDLIDTAAPVLDINWSAQPLVMVGGNISARQPYLLGGWNNNLAEFAALESRCEPNFCGRTITKILYDNINTIEVESCSQSVNSLNKQIWAQLSFGSIRSQLVSLPRLVSRTSIFSGRYSISFPSLVKCPNNQQGSNKAKKSSNPSRKYLIFGGIRSPYLGIQIAGIMLLAFGFTAIASYSLFRRFNYGNRKWRWILLGLASSACALFFWGWAWGGHPLLVWGVAN